MAFLNSERGRQTVGVSFLSEVAFAELPECHKGDDQNEATGATYGWDWAEQRNGRGRKKGRMQKDVR